MSKSRFKRVKKEWVMRAGLVLAAILIFTLGWAGGSGRLKLHLLGNKTENNQLPAQLDYSSVNELYQDLKTNYDGKLDVNKLTDGLKAGLINAAGNPYTEYLTAQQYQEFNGELNGTFTGIGAELSLNSQNQVTIISPISGFPADKAGLKPQDVIASINGQSTSGMNVSAAVDKIRGPKGSTVDLVVIRPGQPLPLTFKITRDNINVPSVTYNVTNGIGYMKISTFGDDTADLALKAAQSFKQQNVKGVVVDLRDDPGGLLDAAVSVSSLWLPQNKTVLTERRNNVVTQTFVANGDNILNGIPTVVLINGGSASASEITAGALHDNGAATLLGTKSYGKGSVQQVVSLKNGGVLKVTVARWYTPDGKNIDKQGLTPDKTVNMTDEQQKAGQDPQKDAALSLLPR